MRLEEACLCKESVLHSGPTEIQKDSQTNYATSKTSTWSIHHAYKIEGSVSVHLQGLIVVLVSVVKRQSQTGVIFFSRALSTITIQDKEIDEENPGYVQL